MIPTKKEPIRSPVPMRRFRYDERHDIVKCPRGKILKPGRRVKHGRFFTSRARDCSRCDLRGFASQEPGQQSRRRRRQLSGAFAARRRRERWGEEETRLYRRHRWRAEGFHGEAKTWHGLARAVRRGLDNMRIQSFLTAAAINLKRLATAILALMWALSDVRQDQCAGVSRVHDKNARRPQKSHPATY